MGRFRNISSSTIIKRGSIIIFGLTLGLALAEIMVRILDPYPYVPPWEVNNAVHGNLMQFDPVLGWRGAPNSADWHVNDSGRVWIEHNRAGFRDLDPAVRSTDKPAVVFLGDSFTWGYEVDFDAMFVNILRQEFEAWEMYNLAHQWYGTDQALLVFREWDESSNIELVILMFSENDFGDNQAVFRGGNPKPKFQIVDESLVLANVPLSKVDGWDADPPMVQVGPASVADWGKLLFFQSHLLHELYFRRQLSQNSGLRDLAVEESQNAPPLELSHRLLQELEAEVERRGGHLIVIAIPSKAQFIGLDGLVPYQEYLRTVCQELDIEYFDLAPYFEGRLRRTYFRWSMHWNVYGHKVAAEAISDYLQARTVR